MERVQWWDHCTRWAATNRHKWRPARGRYCTWDCAHTVPPSRWVALDDNCIAHYFSSSDTSDLNSLYSWTEEAPSCALNDVHFRRYGAPRVLEKTGMHIIANACYDPAASASLLRRFEILSIVSGNPRRNSPVFQSIHPRTDFLKPASETWKRYRMSERHIKISTAGTPTSMTPSWIFGLMTWLTRGLSRCKRDYALEKVFRCFPSSINWNVENRTGPALSFLRISGSRM